MRLFGARVPNDLFVECNIMKIATRDLEWGTQGNAMIESQNRQEVIVTVNAGITTGFDTKLNK